MVADFLEDLSENIHARNTAHIYIGKLNEMKKIFGEMDLPKTREEFEVRAALLQLVNEMNEYLIIKDSFKGMETSPKVNEKRKVEAN
jgi:uncharacterized membrane protein YgaE (UPF0421/DUF939 family)